MLHRTHKSPSVTRSNKSSKIDKQRWISSNLHHLHLDYIGSPSDHWKTIKRIRSKYQLRSYEPNQLINLTGLHLLNLKNHTFSNSKPLPDPIEDPLAPPQADLDIAFTMFELYRAFRRTKTGRAPGPDSHPLEASRLLPHPVKRYLLPHYNDCLLLGTAPDHWKLSKVVMIYMGNQKNSRSPSSYSPYFSCQFHLQSLCLHDTTTPLSF